MDETENEIWAVLHKHLAKRFLWRFQRPIREQQAVIYHCLSGL